ncbi:helix-turn-helix domain-containing protein [Brevibacillus brevis]|uniref:helix-turn-helix domain-containing protein n=1 Tax=Brevibacillus brevis TaxID=1393 RepID=UPI001C8CFDA7|nr:helix-turn-helix transcriptional regulator [Brevibacillus brevis]MBY0088418.1 helix-turn-helix transcriptional regulator [Brevibacillus brevis]
MSIAQRITDLRKSRGWSQDQLAEKLAMNRANVSNYERGIITNLPSEVLLKLSEIFNVTVDYLLCKTDVNLYDWVPSPAEEAENKTKETPASYENEKEFLSNIDLSDDELLAQFKLSVDGRDLTQKEVKKLLAFLRMERSLED